MLWMWLGTQALQGACTPPYRMPSTWRKRMRMVLLCSQATQQDPCLTRKKPSEHSVQVGAASEPSGHISVSVVPAAGPPDANRYLAQLAVVVQLVQLLGG